MSTAALDALRLVWQEELPITGALGIAVVSAPPRAFVDTPSSWGAAPAGSAPSWATHDPDPGSAPQPSPSVGFAAAVAEPHVVDDSAVSFDDEDIVELGEVGIPVVERILGATIIRDEGT